MVHQYQLNGYNIVLDTCSGAIHVVDEVAYDIIALYPDHTADEIVTAMMEKYGAREDVTEKDLRDCIDDVEALKQAGKLYTPDTFADMAGTFKERSGDVVKALCLHVAHTCNLNCSYCFASQGKYHGDRALMSYEVGKQALDFLMDHSGTRHNLEVDFFGGEPLMNFDVVKRLVAYARSVEKERGKHFRFTLTTNGVLIDDDVIDFANREMSNVVLSLDGRKEVHDRYRVDYAGNGSWEKIVPKFQKLVQARQGKNYYMRGTFTHANPDFLKDIQTMLDLGFTELSMEPVVAAHGDPAALTEADKEIVMQQYEELARLMLQRDKEGRPFTFYHYMIDLKGGPCIYKRISGCGSGTEYMAVTPWGDLYPCHQFVGDEKFKLGNIWDGVENHAVQAEFAGDENIHVLTIETDDAWARDVGPTCVVDDHGTVRGVDWQFNAWGGMVDGLYAHWEKDNAAARAICAALGMDCYDAQHFVLEGGSIHSDGEGTILATEACLLSRGRNPELSRAEIEQELKNYLGAQKIVWLPRGIYNDETNEHVDNVCAYVGPAEVVLAWTEDENDPQYALSRASLDALEAATDAKGRHFTVHKLPIPAKPICVTEEELQGYVFEEGEDTREAGERLAASYVNFYISNGGIILPQFGDENDAEAVRILGGLFPGRRVYPIPARSILVGGGNIHCVTQQIPRG